MVSQRAAKWSPGEKLRGALVLLALAGAASQGLAKPSVRLTPTRISMGSFYSGARLRIDGLVAQGSKAIVLVRGADREEIFNRKARFGPIWANSGTVRISGAPSLMLCFSPEPVRTLLDSSVIRERLLDEAAISARIGIAPRQEARAAAVIRADYLSLKLQDGLYQIRAGAVSMGTPHSDGAPFAVELLWPKRAPPASYSVQVLECRAGVVVGEVSAPLEVVKVGFPESLAALATEHASAYGVLAVLVAASAGFGIDFVSARLFGRKRRAPH